MEKEKIKSYVDKTYKFIEQKGYIFLDRCPDFEDIDRYLCEYVMAATRIRVYEKITEISKSLKKRIPSIKKLKEIVGRRKDVKRDRKDR